jgi:hypothetical protein
VCDLALHSPVGTLFLRLLFNFPVSLISSMFGVPPPPLRIMDSDAVATLSTHCMTAFLDPQHLSRWGSGLGPNGQHAMPRAVMKAAMLAWQVQSAEGGERGLRQAHHGPLHQRIQHRPGEPLAPCAACPLSQADNSCHDETSMMSSNTHIRRTAKTGIHPQPSRYRVCLVLSLGEREAEDAS